MLPHGGRKAPLQLRLADIFRGNGGPRRCKGGIEAAGAGRDKLDNMTWACAACEQGKTRSTPVRRLGRHTRVSLMHLYR